jgi:ABC-type multidrug transport system ATPase subunit
LDEATSALDTESEHLVQEAIYSNLKGKSVILIAHRLSTVEKADKIIVINKGRVEQMGKHEGNTNLQPVQITSPFFRAISPGRNVQNSRPKANDRRRTINFTHRSTS